MKPTFGTTIRAARMGYHAVEGIGFVRIRAGGPPWHIDVAPFDHVPVEKGKVEYHVWWSDADSRRLGGLTILQHVHADVTRPRVLLLDDDGNEVKP
jgi:hypothetical protein